MYSTFASRSSASGAALSRRPSPIRRAASAAHNEPLRSRVDRLVLVLKSAPTTAPSASLTAWPLIDTDLLPEPEGW